jgi:hypothetical protein
MIITFSRTFDLSDSCGELYGELDLFKSSLYYSISIYIILMLLYKNNNIRK